MLICNLYFDKICIVYLQNIITEKLIIPTEKKRVEMELSIPKYACKLKEYKKKSL